MAVKAIIFDLFGTLVPTFPQQELQTAHEEMCHLLNLDIKAFQKHWHETIYDRFDGSWPNFRSYLISMATDLGVNPDDKIMDQVMERVDYFFRIALQPRPETDATLITLQEKNIRIGLMSDCSWPVIRLWEETPYAKHIDAPLFSCQMGMCKPDPRFYIHCLEKLAASPEETIYVGDGGSHELSGAQKMGMRPLLLLTNTYAPYREEADTWEGERIKSLTDVLDLI